MHVLSGDVPTEMRRLLSRATARGILRQDGVNDVLTQVHRLFLLMPTCGIVQSSADQNKPAWRDMTCARHPLHLLECVIDINFAVVNAVNCLQGMLGA